jgi:hypothetical protein
LRTLDRVGSKPVAIQLWPRSLSAAGVRKRQPCAIWMNS